MRDYIKIKNINKSKNIIIYEFEVSGKITKYFNQNYMKIEYGENIENIPNSISIIPFLSNILPIIWFSNSEIIINEIDEVFLDSINNIKIGFENMYDKKLGGSLLFDKIVCNKYTPSRESVSLFSGGVDSLSTIITNINEKPILATLWGSDISINNYEGWSKVKSDVEQAGKVFGLNNSLIKSDFREVINNINLDILCRDEIGFNYWWENIQHGMALIGHLAPICYNHKIKKIYIPGTLCEEYKNKVSKIKLGSDPTIDNEFKFASCTTYHEGFEYNRQEKIVNIMNYKKETYNKFDIRVCFSSYDGNNCCLCRKCAITILGIIEQKMNPNDFGFNVDENTLKTIKHKFENEFFFADFALDWWKYIKEEFNKENEFWNKYDEINWILSINTDDNFNEFKKLKSNINEKVNKHLVKAYINHLISLKQINIHKLYEYVINSKNTLNIKDIIIYIGILEYMLENDEYISLYNKRILNNLLMYNYILNSQIYNKEFISTYFENIITDENDILYMKMIKILKLKLENDESYVKEVKKIIDNKKHISKVKVFINLLNDINILSDEVNIFNKEFENQIVYYLEQSNIQMIMNMINEYDNNFKDNKLTIKHKSILKAINNEIEEAEEMIKSSLINNLFEDLNYSYISLIKEIQNDTSYNKWHEVNILGRF